MSGQALPGEMMEPGNDQTWSGFGVDRPNLIFARPQNEPYVNSGADSSPIRTVFRNPSRPEPLKIQFPSSHIAFMLASPRADADNRE